jgi:hypothetical protein
MPPRTRWVIALCLVTTVATVAYWVLFFWVPGSVQSSAEACYLTYEHAFPVADGWMAVATLACAVALIKRRPSALLWGLLGASAMIYLGCMDVLYDLENGMYAHATADMAVEVVINVFALAVGAWFITWFWRHRAQLLAPAKGT